MRLKFKTGLEVMTLFHTFLNWLPKNLEINSLLNHKKIFSSPPHGNLQSSFILKHHPQYIIFITNLYRVRSTYCIERFFYCKILWFLNLYRCDLTHNKVNWNSSWVILENCLILGTFLVFFIATYLVCFLVIVKQFSI